MDISIVLGTYNRTRRPKDLVASIAEYTTLDYEIVVADGGSTDGSREFLAQHPRVLMIGERYLHGAVDAYNKAFSVCKAPYVAHLNDDCVLEGDCLDAACRMLDRDESIGQVAIPFYDYNEFHITDPIVNKIHTSRGFVLYANFGVVRREAGDAVGWWGNYLHTYGGDCELSFRIWDAGYRVDALSGYAIRHFREADELRRENTESRKFFEKWSSWTPPRSANA